MAGESKTEKATSKKRRDERKKGNVFSSKDIISVASILVTFSALNVLFPSMVNNINTMFYRYINYMGTKSAVSVTYAGQLFMDGAITLVLVVAPIMMISLLTNIIATGAQTRFLFATESLKPKFSRLSPLQGFKRMFSLRSLVEIVKGIIKIIIILYILYKFFMGELEFFSKIHSMDIYEASKMILKAVLRLVYNICIIFVFIAALDYIYQWWEYEKNIKMSKHDVKEEYKQMEGDPKIKGKIKEKQRDFAMSRMMQQVPSSDVVIRNPTHYAVALRYDGTRDNAPVVVAKGQDEIALRIVRVANENDVYVLENKELTRAIYAATEINQEIALEHYNSVAEILALVYKIKNKQI